MPGSASASRMLLAIAVGYGVAVAMVVAGTFAAAALLGLPAQGPPTTPHLVANVAVSFLGAVCAGYACARLAPADRRAITVGLLMLLFLGAAAAWRSAPETQRQPAGYLPLVTLLGVVGLWTGAMIERARHGTSREKRL